MIGLSTRRFLVRSCVLVAMMGAMAPPAAADCPDRQNPNRRSATGSRAQENAAASGGVNIQIGTVRAAQVRGDTVSSQHMGNVVVRTAPASNTVVTIGAIDGCVRSK